MILLALALGQAPVVDAVPTDDRIIVMARLLKTWRGSAKMQSGELGCVTRRSTGDRDIDAVACKAMTTCMSRLQPDIAAATAKGTLRKKRDVLLAAANLRLSACADEQHQAGLEALADARATKQIESQNAPNR